MNSLKLSKRQGQKERKDFYYSNSEVFKRQKKDQNQCHKQDKNSRLTIHIKETGSQ